MSVDDNISVLLLRGFPAGAQGVHPASLTRNLPPGLWAPGLAQRLCSPNASGHLAPGEGLSPPCQTGSSPPDSGRVSLSRVAGLSLQGAPGVSDDLAGRHWLLEVLGDSTGGPIGAPGWDSAHTLQSLLGAQRRRGHWGREGSQAAPPASRSWNAAESQGGGGEGVRQTDS